MKNSIEFAPTERDVEPNKMNNNDYNEHEVLKNYVLAYYDNLFTHIEGLAFRAAIAEFKAQNSGPLMAKRIRDNWAYKDNPEVMNKLSDGYENFREKVFNRLISEHNDQIFINRCPSCSKVAKTPKTKQCPWCFHDWH